MAVLSRFYCTHNKAKGSDKSAHLHNLVLRIQSRDKDDEGLASAQPDQSLSFLHVEMLDP